jgi:hypothetical protein
MYTYTMTFVNEDELGLFSGYLNQICDVRAAVLAKLSKREFTLADFNWTGNYDPTYIRSYLNKPYHCTSVVEIRLDLDRAIISSRDAIYERCITALRNKEIDIRYSKEFYNEIIKKHQNLIIFDSY